MKPRHLAAALLLAVAPATVSLPAWSQDDASTVQARARFKEGVEAYDKGKYEEARLAFLQAYTLKKHPSVLLNLAQSSAKSNHPLEASKYFQQFLREAVTATPQQKRDAEQGLAEVRQKLGRIEVVAPAGTEISLDEQGRVGTTPMDAIDVEPGQHTVKSPAQSVTVIATLGQKVEAKLGGPPPSVAPPAAVPPPAASSSPVEPAPAQNPPPGADTGTVSKSSAGLFSPPENMTPVYIGLGVGAVGGISALVFGLLKLDAQSKADDVVDTIHTAAQRDGFNAQGLCKNPPRAEYTNACNTLESNNSKVDADATIANVSLIVGGAGLVFAGAWYLFAPKREDSKSTGQRTLVMPYTSANGGGVSFSGRF
jgi:hypothetical protein